MMNLLVIFHRKAEDIHDENYINYCHVINRKYNNKVKFLVLPKIILQKPVKRTENERWDSNMKHWNVSRSYHLFITRFKRSEHKVDLSIESCQAALCLSKYIFVPLMLTIKYDFAKVALMESKTRIRWNIVELTLKRWLDT